MPAAIVNLTVDQGDTFNSNLLFVNQASNTVIDLTAYTVNHAVVAVGHTVNTYSIPLTVNLYSNGIMTLGLTANQTAGLSNTEYVYSVNLQDLANNVIRAVQGYVYVNLNSY